ncbi:hypothetical protein M9458_048496, partial [Cirrhinus mrigala]
CATFILDTMAERRLHSWGSQLDLVEGISCLTHQIRCPFSFSAVSSPRGTGSTLHLSSSEEVDVETVDELSAPQFPQYEELLEVVTRAVAKLNIDWPAEPQVEPQKSKLDERFLRPRPPPARRSLPFFPDLHTEVSRSWKSPFSSRLFIPASYNYDYVAGLDERGYRAMPRVEQTLASYLRTADLSLRATKETARAIGRSMAALVAAERHLWLTLSDMKEKDRVFLLDAPLSPAGLFGDAVNAVVDRYQEARKQAAAFQRFLPRHHPAHGAAATEQPRPSTSSSHREAQKQSSEWSNALARSEGRASVEEVLDQAVLTGRDRRGQPHLGGNGSAPQYSVSGSLCQPCRCFRAQRSPASIPPQFFPPGNVAGLGSSPPPRGSLGPLVQVLPAGQPFQDTVPAAHITPEASLERLVPLVDHLAAWKLLPNVSAWVLHTVERGYRIQFGAPPPPFNGVSPTLVGPEQ